ncbi:hypothetical protein [Ensifer aridi]|uniref:hypothetical protein n=1 Tax=Ensifer aridi TaxID=1708715 RepID=UPI000A10D1C3|nr:hypothetical protein [Ensifer aridi]
MIIDRKGTTRIVFLIGLVAIKVPNFLNGWKLFLCGLLANMQERQFGAAGWDGLCPVLWSLPGGWVVVMRRARVMTPEEFLAFDAEAFCNRSEYVLPVEAKSSSFGFIDGQIVAVDYGS